MRETGVLSVSLTPTAYGFDRAGGRALLWSTREDFPDLVARALAMDAPNET